MTHDEVKPSKEPAAPFRFAINPVVQEGNARRLVDIMAQSFSSGARSEELRIRFEEVTGLKRQSFYDTLAYAKYRQWVVGGGQGVPYQLNCDGSWKLPPTSTGEATGEPLSRDQLEHTVSLQNEQIGELRAKVEDLCDWSSSSDTNGANVALSSLIRIVGDSAASTRQRIRASAAVLGYKTQGDASEFARKFLQSVCEDTDIPFDYRIEAGELLRKHEAPRVVSETVRPAYSSGDTEAGRTEAWRTYERWQLRKQIVLGTREPPPPSWDNHLQADTYVAPEGSSMPPVRVVTARAHLMSAFGSKACSARMKARRIAANIAKLPQLFAQAKAY